MPFTPTNFQNSPATSTPITASELNKLGTQHAQVAVDVANPASAIGAALSATIVADIKDRVWGGARHDIRDYGAEMDAILLTDAVTVAGLKTVSSASRAFVNGDVGKTIAVMGAGPVVANANDGVWISTIASVSAGVATLVTNATSSGTGQRAVFGTPDDDAFSDAQDAAATSSGIAFGLSGGTVYIPPGRTIATIPLPVKNFVSWVGESRESSWVHIIQDAAGDGVTAGTAGTCDWLTCAGRSSANPLIGADFHDFGIEAEAHIHTGGYGSAMKPLNIYYVKRCSIQRMNVWHTPATSIPFDHSYDQVTIRDNIILTPGRLAPSGVGPGGSGIGAGTKGTGATEPTLIENNIIIGTHTAASNANGHNGIFTEAQTGADPDLGVAGYRIVGNVIIGMYYGISDTGSTGTIIQGNTIIGCSRGISLRKTTLPAAYPGLNTTIANNTIRGSVGPASTDGIGIAISMPSSTSANIRRDVHTIITGNQIIDNQSWGISVGVPSGGTLDIAGLMVHGNQIGQNGRSGIRLTTGGGLKILYPSIKDNQIYANGRGETGDQSGVLIPSGTIIEGGRIQDNDFYDLAVSPTQLAGITSTGATLNDVTVSGNTPEPPAPDPQYVDDGDSAAGSMVGATVPDGTLTNKTWTLLNAGGSGGVWSYTGTAMKPSAGTGRQLLYVDLNTESATDPDWLHGIASAEVAALATPPAETFSGIAVNVNTENSYLFFGPRYNSATWKYRFARRITGSDTSITDIAVTPVVGDVIAISLDGVEAVCYVNGVIVHTFPWATTHYARWGMLGAFGTDPTSSLKSFTYNSTIVI